MAEDVIIACDFGSAEQTFAFLDRFTEEKILSLGALSALLTTKPRSRFQIPLGNDFSIWDLEEEYTIDPAEFLSKGKATPFAGHRVSGRCKLTVFNGKPVFHEVNLNGKTH